MICIKILLFGLNPYQPRKLHLPMIYNYKFDMQSEQNQELHRRFEKNDSFRREMQAVSRKFMEFQQQIYYSPLKHIHPSMIIRLQGANEFTGNHIRRREDLYIFNGQYQPTGEQSFERLVLQVVQSIPRPKSAFGFIYINTFAEGNAYNDFKKVFELLPVQYLFNLTKIFVIDASFISKALSFLSFGTVTNYIKNKTVNIETLTQLSQHAQIDLQLLTKALPKHVVLSLSKVEQEQTHSKNLHSQYSQDIQLNAVNEGIRRNQSSGQGESKSSQFTAIGWDQVKVAQPNVTKSALSIAHSTTKRFLAEYQVGPSGAPIILQMLIYFFSNNDESLKLEGLFRKSVSIDDETEIIKELNDQNYNYLATVTNPHIIANAIKRFLSNFKEPVIPYKLFDAFMQQDSEPHYKQFVVESLKQLPKINRMTLFLLVDFLRNRVLQFAPQNKMTENNLCIVFGPCLMRSQVASIKELIYARKVIVVSSILFRQFETIFGDKNEQTKMKRNSYKEYRIEENKNRQNKSNKEKKQSIQEAQERQGQTEKEVLLLHRTSEYIKEKLENSQNNSSDDQPEQIIEIKSIIPKNINFNQPSTHSQFDWPENIQQPVLQASINPRPKTKQNQQSKQSPL